jgi:predicted ATPase with chaperone activity
VGESRERVRSALTAIGLALPPGRITINLALDQPRNQKLAIISRAC